MGAFWPAPVRLLPLAGSRGPPGTLWVAPWVLHKTKTFFVRGFAPPGPFGGFVKLRTASLLTTIATKIPRGVQTRATMAPKSLFGTSWRLLGAFGGLDGQKVSLDGPNIDLHGQKTARPGYISRPHLAPPRGRHFKPSRKVSYRSGHRLAQNAV